jgi:hypothetical protein
LSLLLAAICSQLITELSLVVNARSFLVSAKLQGWKSETKIYDQPFYVRVILLEGENE